MFQIYKKHRNKYKEQPLTISALLSNEPTRLKLSGLLVDKEGKKLNIKAHLAQIHQNCVNGYVGDKHIQSAQLKLKINTAGFRECLRILNTGIQIIELLGYTFMKITNR